MRPVARTNGLVVRLLGDETLVYDTRRHHAHCLNRTAALVFRASDGSRTTGEIAAELGSDTPTDAAEEAVERALERLAEVGLLASEYHAPPRTGTSRREVLRRVGFGAALAAPIVTSLVVPTPAEAAASCIQEASCTDANAGQPCYVIGLGECSTKECKSGPPGICGPF